MYLHLFEIVLYPWLGSVGDTTEFLFASRSKITRNSILRQLTNNVDFLSVRGTAVKVVSFSTVILSGHATRSLSNVEYWALCDEIKQQLRTRQR